MSLTIQTSQAAEYAQTRVTPGGSTTQNLTIMSDTVTTLDPTLAAAVVQSTRLPAIPTAEVAVMQSPYIRPLYSTTQAGMTSKVLQDLGQAMSQGQGAYVVSYVGRGGGMVAAVTPQDFARMLNGSFTQNSVSSPLRQALQAALRQHEQSATKAPAPYMDLNNQETPDGIAVSVLAGHRVAPPAAVTGVAAPAQPAEQYTTDFWELQSNNSATQSTLSVIYIPPSHASIADTEVLTSSSQPAVGVNIMA